MHTKQTLDEVMAERQKHVTEYMETHPILCNPAVCETLAGLLTSEDEKVRVQAVRLWGQFTGQFAPQQMQVEQQIRAEDLTKLDEALKGLSREERRELFDSAFETAVSTGTRHQQTNGEDE